MVQSLLPFWANKLPTICSAICWAGVHFCGIMSCNGSDVHLKPLIPPQVELRAGISFSISDTNLWISLWPVLLLLLLLQCGVENKSCWPRATNLPCLSFAPHTYKSHINPTGDEWLPVTLEHSIQVVFVPHFFITDLFSTYQGWQTIFNSAQRRVSP